MKRAIAAALVSALVLTCPGLLPYAAAADVVNTAAPKLAPIPIGTSQLNVLKGAGALPVAPGALGIDTTIHGAPSVPALPAGQAGLANPGAPLAAPGSAAPGLSAPDPGSAKLDEAAPISEAVKPGLAAIAKPGASGETSAKAGDEVATILQGGAAQSVSDEPAVAGSEATAGSGLLPSAGGGGSHAQPPAPPAASGASSSGPSRFAKLKGFVASAARVALAATAVLAIQAAVVAALPAIFGAAPIAAVWAVSSGALLLPAGLYTRYLLSKHDSPALKPVKLVLDLSIGAFLGAVVIAAPAFSLALAAQVATSALPYGAAASALTFLSGMGGGKVLDVLATGGVLAGLPLIMGVAGAGAIALGPILGMMALPVMTTLSFFLGSIVRSAETGRPFSVPGTLQKLRFPAFNWVMMGVVTALTSGYGAVLTNLAFLAWTFLGDKGNQDRKAAAGLSFGARAAVLLSVGVLGQKWAEKLYRAWQRFARTKAYAVIRKVLAFALNFNVLYAGLLAFTAATGFSSPLTFLVIAFAPERAAHWTERLLRKLYPGTKPSPSTQAADAGDSLSLADRVALRAPKFYHWAKTAAILAVMLGVGFAMGAAVFGFAALLKNLLVAALLVAPQFFLSRWLVKKLMKAEVASPQTMPRYYASYKRVVDDVQNLVNTKRRAGKKPIPTPEMVRIPTDLPNAFATGPGPFHATIGVTDGIMDMLLDPQNARDGLIRLIETTAKKPQGKSYQVFRKAIAGSIPGVAADATPQEVQQALMRAGDDQIQALGERMLRGVLGHEFSHVVDRHMLAGSIAGAISSGVAFASYGVMWGVGHAKAAAGRLFGRKDAAAPGAPGARAEELTIDAAKARASRPEALEPVSTGVVMKSLPALLRVFAALWGPTILQIIQMAGSRNNESQADADGAYLTNDPESLALALGMLTTWRPKAGFSFEFAKLPRLAALSQFMTVNPIEQLARAGALPKDDSLPAWASGKNDDWMFDLWVTHPDTLKRIEALHDISETLHDPGKKAFDSEGKPPTGGGGSLAPPLAFAPAPAVGGRGGFFRRAWAKVADLYHVLPEKSRNREFWKFVWGQALINLGIDFHYTALPKLVDPKDDQPQRVLYNRAVNAGSQLASSLTTGGPVDRYSVQKILVWTYLGRALMLLAVPILFHFGLLSFLAFQLIIFAAGFLTSTSITAASVAFNRILADDTAQYNKANAVFNLVTSLVGVVGPLMAGSFIVLMDARFGLLSGNALSYGVYGAAVLGALWIYRKLKIPRDELLQARRDLWQKVKAKREGFWRRLRAVVASLFIAAAPAAFAAPRIKTVSAGRADGASVLLVEVKGDVSAVQNVPATFEGYPVKVVPARSVWRELVEGFRLIFGNRFLRVYLLFSTAASLTADPVVFSALPKLIDGMLKIAPDRQGGVFGLYMAATGLGTGVASFMMMLLRDRSEGALEAALAGSEKALGERLGGAEKAALALDAAREAKDAVLARCREKLKSDPAWSTGAPVFQRDLLAETAARLNAKLFAGAETDEELARLLQDSGLGPRLSDWAARHFDALMRQTARDARTGLNAMERQGRWSSWLSGLGWLLYWGVFFLPGLRLSLTAMVVASMLQAPAMAIWSALVQRVLGSRYPEDMGKIYSAINFYSLVFGILGPVLFSRLVRVLPTVTVLAVSAAALTAVACLDFLQPKLSFPLDRAKRDGPKA